MTAIVFEGGEPRSDVEEMVVSVRKAIALDNLEKLQGLSGIERVILFTNYRDLATEASQLGVFIEFPRVGERFHFGSRLLDIVRRHRCESVLYLGGAIGSLLTGVDFAKIVQLLSRDEPVLVTNNLFSSDIIGFSPAEALELSSLPSQDNSLAMALQAEKGLPVTVVEDGAGWAFDVDTPSDVMVLGVCPPSSERIRRRLGTLALDLARLEAARQVFKIPYSDVLLFGRVNPSTVAFLNRETQCRIRAFSEERGMRALGRLERSEVVSLMGLFLERIGPGEFFRLISKTCQAGFIDTRVLFAHFKLNLSREERFSSDLGCPERVKDPLARAITEAILASEVPLIPGGHSLIYGGIRVLAGSVKNL